MLGLPSYSFHGEGEGLSCSAQVHFVLSILLFSDLYINNKNFRSVKMLAKFMNKVMAKRVGCTILYASKTGTAERYAYELQNLFNHAFNTTVMYMH